VLVVIVESGVGVDELLPGITREQPASKLLIMRMEKMDLMIREV
jgi:hypothetical protein